MSLVTWKYVIEMRLIVKFRESNGFGSTSRCSKKGSFLLATKCNGIHEITIKINIMIKLVELKRWGYLVLHSKVGKETSLWSCKKDISRQSVLYFNYVVRPKATQFVTHEVTSRWILLVNTALPISKINPSTHIYMMPHGPRVPIIANTKRSLH